MYHPRAHIFNVLKSSRNGGNIARVFASYLVPGAHRCPGIALNCEAFKQRPTATRQRDKQCRSRQCAVIKLFRNVSSMGVPDQP